MTTTDPIDRKPVEKIPAALRQARIVAAFEHHGFVSISALADDLGVSAMTIRRDVALLEEKGLLERTHGGAVAPQSGLRAPFDAVEPAFDQRMRQQAHEKSAIARAAAALILPRESVGLDVGTSVLALAEALRDRADLRIVTNNLRVGLSLAEGRSPVYLIGGQIRGPECSVIGPQAVETLRSHFLDRVFIGVSGMDASGLYDYSPEDTAVKRAFMANARQVVVLCDASKFGRRALSRIDTLERVDVLVTDAEPVADLAAALKSRNIQVIVAR